jgi:hypothetical protein
VAVPITAPVCVSASVASARAMPKSVTFTSRSAVMSTLPGLMSRCTTPLRCAKASAAAMSAPIWAAWRGFSGPFALSTSRSERPCTYSMTMNDVLRSWPQS